MTLIKDVQIFIASGNSNERLLISDSSLKVSTLNGQPCIDNTYIQGSNWRAITEKEKEILILNEKTTKHGDKVQVFKIPELISKEILGQIERNINYINHPDDLVEYSQGDIYKIFLNRIQEFLREQWLREDTDIEVIGLDMNEKGLLSVSIDKLNNCYVGLHLDNWDKSPIKNRHESRSLFCMNMGVDPRFLIFLNLGCLKICELINQRLDVNIDYSQYEPDDLVYKFLDLYPDYPVVKLQIEPNEAYIFPIQNVIHEGVTVGKKFNDVNFMALVSMPLF